MIPGRLRQCLKILRWEAADLADELGRRECEVETWIEGRANAPLAVVAWLEALVKAHQTLIPPGRVSAAPKPGGNEIELAEIRLPEAGCRTIQQGTAQRMTRRSMQALGTGFPGAAGIPAVSAATSSKGGSSHGSRPL